MPLFSAMKFRAIPGLVNTIVALASVSFSVAAFVAVDGFYTVYAKATAKPVEFNQCRVRDPVREHAFQPNCTGVAYWGPAKWQIATNSLGFRDEKVRQVPAEDSRPRLLMLGDSFTEGFCPWPDSFVGKTAAHFPQYDFLNGGVASYSPSNYLNVARMVLAAGVQFDEAMVFIDISDAQDEAAYYRDIDGSGAVAGPAVTANVPLPRWRQFIASHLRLTDKAVRLWETILVGHGYYHLATSGGDLFDAERSAWTYRKVSESKPHLAGYAPLGTC
jgi:hypothetical protein